MVDASFMVSWAPLDATLGLTNQSVVDNLESHY